MLRFLGSISLHHLYFRNEEFESTIINLNEKIVIKKNQTKQKTRKPKTNHQTTLWELLSHCLVLCAK